MKCPYCNCSDTKVIDSRPTEDGAVIRRRRECSACSQRMTTYEKIEEIPIIVVKKNGNREQFDRNKLLKGIIKSCEKRPVSMESMENLAEQIESKISGSLEKEIDSDYVGTQVMEGLRKLDEVAYIRFASVYREFKDMNNFFDELKKMLEEKTNKDRD